MNIRNHLIIGVNVHLTILITFLIVIFNINSFILRLFD